MKALLIRGIPAELLSDGEVERALRRRRRRRYRAYFVRKWSRTEARSASESALS